MASVFLFVFFVLSHLVLLLSAQEGEWGSTQRCPEFHCGYLNVTGFPFTSLSNPECDVIKVDCEGQYPKIQLGKGGRPYEFLGTSPNNTIRMVDTELWEKRVNWSKCESFTDLSLSFPSSSSISFEILKPFQTFFKCERTPPPSFLKKLSCNDYNIYQSDPRDSVPSSSSRCSIIRLPMILNPDDEKPNGLLFAEFHLRVHVPEECTPNDEGKIYCGVRKKGIKIGITQQYLGRHIYIHSFMKMHTNFFFLFRINYS